MCQPRKDSFCCACRGAPEGVGARLVAWAVSLAALLLVVAGIARLFLRGKS